MSQLSPEQAKRLSLWLPAGEHLAKIGNAVWVFMWLYLRMTDGGVMGGLVFTASHIARDLGISEQKVRRDMNKLRDAGYLETWFEGAGLTAWIQLWQAGGPATNKDQAGRSWPTWPNQAKRLGQEGSQK